MGPARTQPPPPPPALPFLLLVLASSGASAAAVAAGKQDCGAVFLSVSSLWQAAEDARGPVERLLELNWDPACPAEWVVLFDRQPPDSFDPDPDPDLEVGEAGEGDGSGSGSEPRPGAPLARVDPRAHPAGFARTNVSLGRPALPAGWDRDAASGEPRPGSHCLGPFWAAAYRAGRLLHSACLRIRPTWMWDHRQQLAQQTLAGLFLPGTHNSGCYHKATASLTRRDTFARYLLTQDSDVWTQLVHGVRYLDVRVGYYPSKGRAPGQHHADRFWVNHDLIRVGPLLPVLRDLRRFLNASRGELVVLDLHRFPVGFHGRPGRHRRLVALLQRELGAYMIPAAQASPSSALANLWTGERRLIVSYGDRAAAQESKWLWPSIIQHWGNQQTPAGLRNYLQRAMDTARPRATTSEAQLWAAMAELTPTPLEVMFKPSGSLRQMADSVNRNLTIWFRDLWWQKANIVATDFFLSNNLIDVAVVANLRRMNLVETR